MSTAVTAVHVVTCFLLVIIVLLQTGKGADMGAVFGGGSSSTIFGSGGAGNLLTKLTTGAAVVFMLTSLFLAYSASHRGPTTILDRTRPSTEGPVAGFAPAEEEVAADTEGAELTADAEKQPAVGEAAAEGPFR